MTRLRRWSLLRTLFAVLALLSLILRLQIAHRSLVDLPDYDLPTRPKQPVSYDNFSSWSTNGIAYNLTVDNDAPFAFAACLVVKDDNLLLSEWLAYHYEVMPLRRLIVLIDSNSETSPQPILNAYAKLTELKVTTWTDSDIIYHATRRARRKYDWSANATKEEKHRLFIDIKQPLFYKLCATQLQEEREQSDAAPAWTMFVDTDEYIAFNEFDENNGYDDSAEEVVQELGLTHRYPETVAAFLHNNQHFFQQHLNHSHCMYLPRMQHAAIQVNQTFLPRSFDEQSFYTFRYSIHANAADSKLLGKTIVDVTQLNPNIIGNPHRINRDECHGAEHGQRFADPTKAFFRVHQHIGSLEDFLSRPEDPSRSVQTFRKRNISGALGWTHFDVSKHKNKASMHWWLVSFVNRVGPETAKALTTDLRQWAIRNNSQHMSASLS